MKKLNVRLERCTGCKRCETACIAAHTTDGDYASTLAAVVPMPPRLFVEPAGRERAAPVVCRHCREALCVSACMTGCMQKDPVTGIVTNIGHEQNCVGCWMCVMACPYGVIVPTQLADAENGFDVALKCDFCPNRDTPACVTSCPNQAIEIKQDGAAPALQEGESA
jgi:carbon-monoxide dehydrogenase iron sulfur subunit